MKRYWLIIGCAFALPLGTLRSASACGGFFCSTSPVDQSGENILFAVDELGVEVHVQINYTGDDAEFAWVVPTRQVPTLSVGIDQLFAALSQSTAPRFSLNWHYDGMCGYGPGRCAGDVCFEDGASGGLPPTPGSVSVVSQEVVGPYDSAVLRADDGQALKSWLTSNGYNLTPAGASRLDAYVSEHDYFVALKLHNGKSVNDIQPIVLRFAGGEPCVPIRLTAIAAQDDMEVTAYLLGEHRAVPSNY